VRHVEPGEVHELAGPELEPRGVAQDAVEVLDRRHALGQDPQPLGAEAAPGVVHDEPGRVLRADRHVAHPRGEGDEPVRHRRLGEEARHDLHHLHERDRVEEVEPGHPLRVGEPGRQGGDRQGGGVRGEDAALVHDPLELAQERALRLEVLHDRLHDDVAAGELGEGAARDEARHGRRGVRRGQLPLRRELLQRGLHGGARLRGRPGPRVEQAHRRPGLRRDLGDAPPHRPGADDAADERPGHHATSNSPAAPMPPPTHIVTTT
jgi:hypothetical protein